MNGRRRFLYASVISIHDSSFLYPACRNCFSRLIQVSQRYSCHRCGCSCEAQDVHYRYKLSLGVADDSQLFKITVFGSCLDEHFGLSADALQRYIPDLTQDSNEHERETAQNLLFQATEFCFIGRNFIFGVKSSENKVDQLSFSGNSFLTSNRYEKDLVACQICVPTVKDVGCTVIDFYNHLLQNSAIRNSQSCSPAAESTATAISQIIGKLSCSYQPCRKQAHPRSGHCLLSPWQLSFGFTSSSVNSSTSVEFAAGDLSNASIHHSGETKTQKAGLLLPRSQTPPISHLQCSGSYTERSKAGKRGKQMDCELAFSAGQTHPAPSSSADMQIANTLSTTSAPITVRSYDSYSSSLPHNNPYWENAYFRTNGICGSDGDFEPTSSCWVPRWNEYQDTSSEEEECTCFKGNEVYRSTNADQHQHASSSEGHQGASIDGEQRGACSKNDSQDSCSNVTDANPKGFKKHLGDGSSDEHHGAGISRVHCIANRCEHHQGSYSNVEPLASSTDVKQKRISSDEVPEMSGTAKENKLVHSSVGQRGVGSAAGCQSTRSNEGHPKVDNNVQPQVGSSYKHHSGVSSGEENCDASSDGDGYKGWSSNDVHEEASSDEDYQGPSIEDEHCYTSSAENYQRDRSNDEHKDTSSTAERRGSWSNEHNAVWDDLPFSESLNEFIAKVENSSNSTAEKHLKVSTPSSVNLSCRSCRSKHASADSHSGHLRGRLQFQQAKAYRRSRCLSSATSVNGQIVQHRIHSKNELVRWEQGRHLDFSLSSQHPALKCDSVNSSSSPRSSLSHFTLMMPQTVNRKPSKNGKSAEKCAGSLCLSTHSAPAQSTSSAHLGKSSASVVEGKTNSCHSSKDLTFISKYRLPLEIHHTDTSEKSDLKFVNDAQEMTYNSLPLDSSNSSDQNSYNGSSDLFGSGDKELEMVFESPCLLKHAESCVLVQSNSGLPHRVSSSTLSPQTAHNVTEKGYLSSVCSPCESDQENLESQDFIPSSQSTPHACSFRGKETSAKTQNIFSPINSKRGRTKLLRNELRQPASNCFKRRSIRVPCPVKTRTLSHATLHDSTSFSPSADLFESDSEDWIPPSARKSLQAVPFPKSTLPRSEIGKMVKYPSFLSKLCNGQGETNGTVQKVNECLDNHKPIFIRKSVVHRNSADYTRAGKSNSPQSSSENANYLSEGSTLLEGQIDDSSTANWSPDLFAEKLIYSQQHKPVQKQLF